MDRLTCERRETNPWGGNDVTGTRCWACHRDFTEEEPVRVIDAVAPKLVHDRPPCANAMIQFVQGQ